MYDSNKAKEILEKKIEQGRVSAAALFERVHREAPHDTIAKGKAMRFLSRYSENKKTGVLELGYGDVLTEVHPHALGQLAQRAGVPHQYLADLVRSPLSWQHGLATTILGAHFNVGETDTRFLVRRVGDTTRGVLSDKYRRLDSRPLLDAFGEECQRVGAVPVDGIVSDTRVSLRALNPTVYEPVPGEVVAFGVEWHNSDFGAGAHSLRAFMLRVWCLNGATAENALSQVHLGRGISDDIELSKKTYELDTRASISALRDVVGGLLSHRRIEQSIATVRAAADKQVTWAQVAPQLSKALLKGEMKAAKDSFESQDVYNLPAGNTMWRVSNALSWIAGSTEDADRKLELQRLAGQVLDGRKDKVAA